MKAMKNVIADLYGENYWSRKGQLACFSSNIPLSQTRTQPHTLFCRLPFLIILATQTQQETVEREPSWRKQVDAAKQGTDRSSAHV